MRKVPNHACEGGCLLIGKIGEIVSAAKKLTTYNNVWFDVQPVRT